MDKCKRKTASYLPRHQRFIVKKRSFEKQYSHLYLKRLGQLRPRLVEAARNKWAVVAGILIEAPLPDTPFLCAR